MTEERTRGSRRKIDVRKALRKQKISQEVYPDGKEFPWYDNLHQYSKNKIHCSCPLCRSKTTNKGKYKSFYYKKHNPSIRDRKLMLDCLSQLLEETEFELLIRN